MEQSRIRTWLNYYKESLHRVEEVILYYNEVGQLVNWNMTATKELGFDGKELGKSTLFHILKNNALKLVTLNDEERTYHYREEQVEASVYRKNNTCYHAQIRVLTIGEEDVYGICIIKNMQELTEVKEQLNQQKEEAAEANGTKNLFLANVTHELRTPLNGMKGMAALLLDSELTREQKEGVQLITQCVENMEKIINELLDYTKLQSGKLELEERSFSYESWIEEIIKLQSSVARRKGLAMEYIGSEKIPAVLTGDSFRLGQVVHNLLNNAIKFTSEGRITVEATAQKKEEEKMELQLIVSDTGIGIKDEEKERLFQSFSQADPSITRKYGGSGLGLAISKGIVEQMGGSLHVESEQGKGSRFYVSVPMKVGDGVELNVLQGEDEETYKKEKVIQESYHFVSAEITTEDVAKLVEKIGLCIELDSFGKAEELTHEIKNRTKETDKAISRLAFRLELSIRKQNKEEILEKYQALCNGIKQNEDRKNEDRKNEDIASE